MRTHKTAEEFELLEQELEETKELLEKSEELREEYKSKYFQFKGIFQKQTYTFYLYQNLTESSREALAGIFKGESFEEFLACGVQPGNIDALWEFARNEALNENIADVVILSKMITYFVHLYNGTNDSPALNFLIPDIGINFDTDQHIRTQNSKPAGVISEVLLAGLSNAFNGEIIKKAVVKID